MNDLRPALLDDLGLMPAIQSLASDIRERGGLAVEVDFSDTVPRLAPDAELALFRAAQEALANVVRHAAATRVAIRLRVAERSLRLTVTDNGRGFPTRHGTSHDPVTHLGLAGMRERIAALGGSTSMTPAVPTGVVVTVELPIGPSS
jgi:two-component system NarL family sensor kinase